MNTVTITIPAHVRSANQSVSFACGAEAAQGQQFHGTTKGLEEVGEIIIIRRQIGPVEHESRKATVINRECPVTGDVVLTLELPASDI